MKKLSVVFAILFLSQISSALCIQREFPFPWPLNTNIIREYENNWLSTQKGEMSLLINRTSKHRYIYFLVNNLTNQRTLGLLMRYEDRLCDLTNSTPFCLYNDKNSLRIEFILQNQCVDSALGILSLTR